MKKLLFGVLFAASFALTSCGGDECYECTEDTGLLTLNFCDGDADLNGVSASDFAEALEADQTILVYTCTKQ